MRVLTFTSLFPNRLQPAHGVFISQRMSSFARRPGNQVLVIAPRPYFPSWLPWSKGRLLSRVPKMEHIAGLEIHHPPYPLLPKVSMPLHGWLMFLGSLSLARRLHKIHNFDFIDSHYVYPDGFAAMLLASTLHLPFVVSARGTDINLFPSFRLIRPMIRATLRRAAAGIAVSASLREAMLNLGMPGGAVTVIGNGVDLERFVPVERFAARQHLGLPLDARLIVSVGGLVEAKGHHHLIAALGSVVAHCPDVRACIIGEGPSRARLEAMIQAHGLQGRVTLVGAQANEELKFWYSAADVTGLTSSREGWPNVILESMACGTPVVATGVGGVPEIIVSSDLGLIVDQRVDSIAAGLQAALQRPWDRALIQRHARQRTWDQVAAELEQWFKTCLDLAPLAQPASPAARS